MTLDDADDDIIISEVEVGVSLAKEWLQRELMPVLRKWFFIMMTEVVMMMMTSKSAEQFHHLMGSTPHAKDSFQTER